MVESLEFEFLLGSAMMEADNLWGCELASGPFELRDGGGVRIDPRSSLPSRFLSIPLLPSVFKSVVPIETDAGDEESNREGSTGGRASSGVEER